jgi:hypothetical protein
VAILLSLNPVPLAGNGDVEQVLAASGGAFLSGAGEFGGQVIGLMSQDSILLKREKSCDGAQTLRIRKNCAVDLVAVGMIADGTSRAWHIPPG